MANYWGHFIKGMGSGVQSGFEMGWKKKQQKKLDDEQKKIAEGTTLFNNMVKQYGEDGVYSDDDIAMLNTSFLAAGAEVQEYIKGTREAILTMNKNKVEQDFQWLELASSWTDGLDPKNAKEIFDYIRSNITTEKGKNYYAAYEKMYEKKYKPAPETFTSPSAVQEKYPEAGYDYTEKGYVPTYQKPTTPTEPSAADKKYDWAIDNYKKGLISFEQLSRFMGTDKDLSSKEQEIELMKQYGATNEEIKKALLGVRPSTPLIVKMVDPNDVLFGTNGIMKDYINSGSQLGEEQKAEIKNNYNVIKPALNEETRKQVEDYLQQIGIDLAETEPISEPEPEPTKSNWFKDTWKKMTTPGGTPAYEGTPKISTEGKEALIPTMTNDELYNALKGLDPSDPIYKALYDEAVKRGLIEK